MKATIACIALALMLVVPPTILWQRQTQIEHRQALIAREHVNAQIEACQTLNEIPAAIVRAQAPGSPVPLSDYDRLALRGWLERAILTQVDHPKTCTVESLNLQGLADIASKP